MGKKIGGDSINVLDKVKIGWKDYKVIKSKPEMALNSDGGICYGKIFYDKREIYINDDYDEEQQKVTLLHEVLHGVDEIYGLGLSEDQVEGLGHGLYALIKDNPTLFK